MRVFYRSIFFQSGSLVLLLLTLSKAIGADEFPVFDCIKPNITFWENIFVKYASTSGLIHDENDLTRIYGFIDLKDNREKGAGKINNLRIKEAKNRYRNILLNLTDTSYSMSDEELQVAALFGPSATREDYLTAADNIRCQVGLRDKFIQGIIRSTAFLSRMKEIFKEEGVPEDLIYLPHVESAFNFRAYSKVGAAGMWQFMHSTGRIYMQVDYVIDERRDPYVSTRAAARLLKSNYGKLQSWPLAITAYNHGAHGMERAKKSKGTFDKIYQEYEHRSFKFASRNFYAEFLAARNMAKNYKEYFTDIVPLEPFVRSEIKLGGFTEWSKLSGLLGISDSILTEFNPSWRPPIYKGQKYLPKGCVVYIPPHTQEQASLALASVPQDFYKPKQNPSRFHQVGKGETVGRIAQRHKVSIKDLIIANNLNHRATIYVGQNLKLPIKADKPVIAQPIVDTQALILNEFLLPPIITRLDSAPAVKEDTIKAVAAILNTPAELKIPDGAIDPNMITGNLIIKGVSSNQKKGVGRIKVQVGETLGHYAEWLDIPTFKVRRINSFSYKRSIHAGQEIIIPLHGITKEVFEEKRYEYHKEIIENFFAAWKLDTIIIYRVQKGDNIWALCNERFDIPLWLIKQYNADVDLHGLRVAQELHIPVLSEKGR